MGYRFTDQWSLFAGYKSGNTDWNQPFRVDRPAPDSRTVQDGNFSVKFDQDGPFVGTSYVFFPDRSWRVEPLKQHAYLGGTYTSDFNSVCRHQILLVQMRHFQFYSNLTGWKFQCFSVGASWTQAMTDNLGLSIGANYHWYKFDTDGTQLFNNYVGGERVNGGSFEGGNLTEKLFTLTASLLYTF